MTITVPGWARHRLKFSTEINRHSLPDSADPDFEFDYVDISRVSLGVIGDEPQLTVFSKSPSRARRLASPGDSIVSTVRTYRRAVAQVPKSEMPQVFSTGFAVIGARPETIHPRFLTYFLQSTRFVERVVAESVGVSYPAINASVIAGYDFWAPSVEQQQAIADFLDRETAQIDAMIEAQRSLVLLADEALGAARVQAVMQGLVARPRVHDERVWGGEHPLGWAVKKVRTFCRAYGGQAPEDVQPADSGRFPYIKVASINSLDSHGYVLEPDEYTDRGIGVIPAPALLLPKRGASIFTNKVGISRMDTVVDSNVMGLTFDPDVADIRFMAHWLLARNLSDLADTAALPQLNNKHIYPLRIALPPLEEQTQIAHHVDSLVGQHAARVAGLTDLTNRLRERREALVTAAVTGRIDPATGIERTDPVTEKEAS